MERLGFAPLLFAWKLANYRFLGNHFQEKVMANRPPDLRPAGVKGRAAEEPSNGESMFRLDKECVSHSIKEKPIHARTPNSYLDVFGRTVAFSGQFHGGELRWAYSPALL
jgi:hypothetical protein